MRKQGDGMDVMQVREVPGGSVDAAHPAGAADPASSAGPAGTVGTAGPDGPAGSAGAEARQLDALDVPKPPDVHAPMCPSRLILEHVTSRWGVLALAALRERTHRFSELRRRVGGVSEKMLAQTLQTLERDGFVHRVAYPVIPPRVEYSLTPLGEEAAAQVWALARWSEQRVPEVLAAREQYDVRRGDGAGAGAAAAGAEPSGGGAGRAGHRRGAPVRQKGR